VGRGLAGACLAGAPSAARAGRGAAVPGAGVFGLYLAGFFALRGGFAALGGVWGDAARLLAPFDRRPGAGYGTAETGPLGDGALPTGLGVLILLLVAAAAYAVRPRPGLAARWPLLLATGGMLVFAISHGSPLAPGLHLAEMPERALAVLGALRAPSDSCALCLCAADGRGWRRWCMRSAGGAQASPWRRWLPCRSWTAARLRTARPLLPRGLRGRAAAPCTSLWAEAAGRYTRIRCTRPGCRPATGRRWPSTRRRWGSRRTPSTSRGSIPTASRA
jgi:hypothetical protein